MDAHAHQDGRCAANTTEALRRADHRPFPQRVGTYPILPAPTGLLATRRQAPLHLWANDIVDGHYGDATSPLKGIAAYTAEILPDLNPALDVTVCAFPYRSSLRDLGSYPILTNVPAHENWTAR